jgi:hypothetical protein
MSSILKEKTNKLSKKTRESDAGGDVMSDLIITGFF